MARRQPRGRAAGLRTHPADPPRPRRTRLAATTLRRRIRRHPLARRARWTRTDGRAHRGVDRPVRGTVGAAVPQHGGLCAHRRRPLHVRYRPATRGAPPADHHRRARVVSAVLGAGCGLGPGVAHDPGRARRRPLPGERPESVVLQRADRRPRHPHGPHRSRRRRAPRDLLLPRRHARRGCRDPADPTDERRRGVRRGLPHRRRGPRRRAHRCRR